MSGESGNGRESTISLGHMLECVGTGSVNDMLGKSQHFKCSQVIIGAGLVLTQLHRAFVTICDAQVWDGKLNAGILPVYSRIVPDCCCG
jgi:hypothetical protein